MAKGKQQNKVGASLSTHVQMCRFAAHAWLWQAARPAAGTPGLLRGSPAQTRRFCTREAPARCFAHAQQLRGALAPRFDGGSNLGVFVWREERSGSEPGHNAAPPRPPFLTRASRVRRCCCGRQGAKGKQQVVKSKSELEPGALAVEVAPEYSGKSRRAYSAWGPKLLPPPPRSCKYPQSPRSLGHRERLPHAAPSPPTPTVCSLAP